MKRFICSVCGYVHEGAEPPEECPVCHQPGEKFREASLEQDRHQQAEDNGLAYDRNLYRVDESCRYMEEIHQMAVTANTISGAMGTKMSMPDWDDILILGAQLNPAPLNVGDPVSTMTVIGKNAKKPMILDHPVYISHMSFGALSKEIKVALAKGSAMAKTAMCSGEGGILPEEREASYK